MRENLNHGLTLHGVFYLNSEKSSQSILTVHNQRHILLCSVQANFGPAHIERINFIELNHRWVTKIADIFCIIKDHKEINKS